MLKYKKSNERKAIVFKWNTHILFTLALFLALREYIDLHEPFFITLPLLALGSLLPDIDHSRSKIGRLVPPLSHLMKHRAWYTHSLAGAFLLPLPFLFFGKAYYLIIAIGCLGHVIADTLTTMGTRFIYPLSKRFYSLKIAKTGGIGEDLIKGLSIFYIVYEGIVFVGGKI